MKFPAFVRGGFEGFRKVFIVMYWKNLTLKVRHYIQTLLEILVPTLLFAAMLAIYLEGGKQFTPEAKDAESFGEVPFIIRWCTGFLSNQTSKVYYTSCPLNMECTHNKTSALAEELISNLKKTANFLQFICENVPVFNHTIHLEFSPIENEQELLNEYARYEYQTDSERVEDLYGGIVFQPTFDYIGDNKSFPELDYTIRFSSQKSSKDTKFLFPFISLSGPGSSGAVYQEFVNFQNLIDMAYIQMVTGEKLLPDSYIDFMPSSNLTFITSHQQMPYPSYVFSNVAVFVGLLLPLFTVMSFCFVVPPILKRIVSEKETGVKELMKLMGLPNWMHWLCWFLDGTISAAISVMISVLLVCVEWEEGMGRVIYYSDGFVIFLFFLLYAMSLIIFLFAFSTLFSSPNLALSIGVIIHLITYIVPASTIDDTVFNSMDTAAKFGLALLPNVNLWWGIKVISSQESRASGVQWSNLFKRAEPSDALTMGAIWGMFIVDMVVFGIVTWYIDSVKPGKYGVARKWYFIFEKSFWQEMFGLQIENENMSAPDDRKEGFFEQEPDHLTAGIAVRNLRKVFKSITGTEVLAVDSVSFSAYDSQITALLGHNGAGKTTTMSVLTGLYSPSGGQAEINGHSITTNMAEARQSLGLCPQHNMLFTDLTVYEHLMIFAMIKGLSWSESKIQAQRYMVDLKIEVKANTRSSKLSGGMKRKVHLGVALIGSSKVVLLDEPTSGMDPEARRVIWDLLQMEKKNRTILLTTHFMEEADVLGDRIAIMARGKVQCYGSPLYLKKKFGDGYTLTLTRGPNCDVSEITELITKNIMDSSLKSNSQRELVYNLPTSAAKEYPALFEDLESNKSKLDFLNLGLAVTTMEDVFLRVGTFTDLKANSESTSTIGDNQIQDESDSMQMKSVKNGNGYGATLNHHDDGEGFIPEEQRHEERLTGLKLWLLQMKGLLIKRVTYTKRRFLLFTIMAMLPFLMAITCQLMINFKATPSEEYEPRTLVLSDYSDSITYYGSNIEGMNTSFIEVMKGYSLMGPYENVSESIISYAENDHLAEYRGQLIVAAEFIKDVEFNLGGNKVTFDELKVMYNSIPVHARPIAQNIVSNTLLKNLDKTRKPIRITTHPLPESRVEFFSQVAQGFISPLVLFYGIALGAGITIFVSVFLLFPLTERVTNAKQVQLMTGVHPVTFWLANILWDGLLFIISMSVFIIILIAMDQRESFSSNGAEGALILVISLFSIGGILMSYVFSFFAKSPPSGFALLIILNILVGSIAPVAVWILGDLGAASDNLLLASEIVRYMFTILPSFPMVRSIMAIAQMQEENNQCTLYFEKETLVTICKTLQNVPPYMIDTNSANLARCCREDIVGPEYAICGKPPLNIPCLATQSLYTWDELKGINIDLIFLTIDLIIFGVILILIETGVLKMVGSFLYQLTSKVTNSALDQDSQPLDSDVQEEADRVNQSISTGNGLAVMRLIKDFGSLRAVNNLSFGVNNMECFGLLGINGAGKTTTFRLLTGDEILSNGNALLMGKNLVWNRSKFLSMIGYCPQFDSIIEVLTGREMLLLFARLRGIKNDQAEADKWLKALDIVKYADRQCGTYSGGNKRKLNVAMALVGNPPILFMDEPTTGVDPAGRRKLWNIIKSIKRNGQSVVLTSHSMEECEALCDRLGIMVNGQFQCMGTTRHIKNKFGQGFTILVKLNTRDLGHEKSLDVIDQLKSYLKKSFNGGCDVKDEHKDFIHFHVTNPKTPWSHLFLTMEGAKSLFVEDTISDYSVSETTLEQVFIAFAKYQRPSAATSSES